MSVPRARSRRRTILKVIALLAAGAAVNVAVAWGESFERARQLNRILRTPVVLGPFESPYAAPPISRPGETLAFGVPFRSMHLRVENPFEKGDENLATQIDHGWEVEQLGIRTTLPLRPLWPGFAINTLFYAGVLWMLFAGAFALRRMVRRRRGQCPACAYPIGTSEVCTECGAFVMPAKAGIQ